MAKKSNGSLWLGMGVATGAALAAWQAVRRRRIAGWQAELKSGRPGTALVTGASSGIGEIYARRLADMGFDLVLVARRADRLEALAREIRPKNGVRVEVLPADLADLQDIARVEARLAGDDISFLVNNAGFGNRGSFIEIPAGETEAMIRVHVLATVRLTHAALPGMLARGRGAVVNVSSVAGFFAMPGDATYGPTKTYLTQFSESLGLSLAGRGVRVQALCPGFTVTGFHSTPQYSGTDLHSQIPGFLWLRAEDVVNESLRCLAAGDLICVPGWIYKFLVFLGRTGIAQVFIDLGSIASPSLVRRIRGRFEQ